MIEDIGTRARTRPARKRVDWARQEIFKRCNALNKKMLHAADFQMARHHMATGIQWFRLTNETVREAVQIRIHYGSGILSVVLRIGDFKKVRRRLLISDILKILSDEEKQNIDRQIALNYLSIMIFRLLWGISEQKEEDHYLPILQVLYNLLLKEVLDLPEVATHLSALGSHPTLVITSHGVLAQIPYAALHDGERYLVERFNVVQASPLFPEGDFATGEIDYKALVGGQPIRSDKLRVLAGGENLQQIEHEISDLQAITSGNGMELVIGPPQPATDWTTDALRWLFEARGIALLSAHMESSSTDARRSVVITPERQKLPIGEALRTPIHADLVILAGCHSVGQTDWLSPKESSVVSLLRKAGADAVISTLWPINDFAARRYNVALVEALAGGASRAAAHGAAQRAVMSTVATTGQIIAGDRLARPASGIPPSAAMRADVQKLAHPRNWSGFILSGAWK